MAADTLIRGRRVLTPQGLRRASVLVHDGIIAAVAAYDTGPLRDAVFDAGELIVMPGLVDTHVHINEPGRTEWEGFASATRAAAAGGITTVVDMPLNSIPATTTVEALRAKRRAAERQLWIDVAFWGGVVPGNTSELRGLVEAGVCGFKCFLAPSGVDEFPAVNESDLVSALAELAALPRNGSGASGIPLLAHAELPGPIDEAAAAIHSRKLDGSQYATWLVSRPRAAENAAIALIARLSRQYGVRVHIVHLSSSDALEVVRRAKAEPVPLTAETCPHYLSFCAEEIEDSATTFKCAPPIRERANRETLWQALKDGVIDLIASDHSPCPPEMKCCGGGDFLRAWGGISSLQLALPAVWTEARRRGFSIEQLATWMSAAPAKLAGLEKRKGKIAPGFDADLVVWDPATEFRVEPAMLHHRHKLSPYSGQMLCGRVEATFLRGQKIFDQGDFPAHPAGIAIRRGGDHFENRDD